MCVKLQNSLVADTAAGKSRSLFNSLDIGYSLLVSQYKSQQYYVSELSVSANEDNRMDKHRSGRADIKDIH